MNDFSSWLKLSADISSNIQKKEVNKCPICQSETVDFQYVGDTDTRIGFLDIWCTSCMNGIHISRVKAPESANILTFNDEKVKARIPDFNQVVR